MKLSIETIVREAQASLGEIDIDQSPRLLDYTRAFNHAPRDEDCAFNVFIFHSQVSEDAATIEYRDVKKTDHSLVDYKKIVEACIMAALEMAPTCRVTFVTNRGFGIDVSHSRLSKVELDTNISEPMYERVYAMCAFVHSSFFDRPTIFLDSDAFLTTSLPEFFHDSADIGLTYRRKQGFMPVNEGVIFANAHNASNVQQFFRYYVGTYENLIDTDLAKDVYGNIKRWRGGQLSLNTIAGYDGMPHYTQYGMRDFARIKFIPCHYYNYTFGDRSEYFLDELATKEVLHLKGPRKDILDDVVRYVKTRKQQVQ